MVHRISRRLFASALWTVLFFEPAHSGKNEQGNSTLPQRGSLRQPGFQPLAKPPSGMADRETPPRKRKLQDDVMNISAFPTRDKNATDFFDCNTTGKEIRCGMHAEYKEIKGQRFNETSAEHKCIGAITKELTNGFGKFAVETCVNHQENLLTWKTCRRSYCGMYDNVVMAITNGTNEYMGNECEPLLHYNKTICEVYYRDAWAWCDCICPALAYYDGSEDCKEEILAYILFGHHGEQLIKQYYLTDVCTTWYCKWLEKVADPRQKIGNLGDACFNAQLPFQRSQCENLMSQAARRPEYRPCPWEDASSKDFVLNCTDGYECDVRNQSWACCQRHASRAQCPKNFPVMCGDPLECVGETDHCCVELETDCNSGLRTCSPLMAPTPRKTWEGELIVDKPGFYLVEWLGYVPPNGPLFRLPTTTMSMKEYMLWLSRQTTTPPEAESWGEDFMPYVPFVTIPLGIVCCCCSAVLYWFFGRDVWTIFSKTVFGSRRLLQLMTLDVVHKFSPQDAEAEWDDMPPRLSQSDIFRMEADDAVSKELEKVCTAAFAMGRVHLVSVSFATGLGPRKEARDIEQAIANVQKRALENIEQATLECDEKKVVKDDWNELVLHDIPGIGTKFMVYRQYSYFTTGGLPGAEGAKFNVDESGYLTYTDSSYVTVDREKGVVRKAELLAHDEEEPKILVTFRRDNARLIEEGTKWANTLWSEIAIVEAIDEATPCLNVDFRQLTKPPIAGAPWASTTVGHALACDEKRKVWSKVEELRDQVKKANHSGASRALVEVAQELLAELVARTPELPADRCVLDPEGHGVKLLPKGRQRALWVHTGDSYMYEPDKVKASELNNFELPPKEELTDTSVKAFRPVCATYQTKTCKLGKRCPWRHCTPQPGDTVREPIMF